MFKEIASCQKCTLQLCQKPLLDKLKKGAVMVVGVSAKQIHANSEIPLDNSTRSGQLVSSMEKIAMHPCVNTATVALSTNDFIQKILPASGHDYKVVTLE